LDREDAMVNLCRVVLASWDSRRVTVSRVASALPH
jgi:hypothetical protein